MNKYKLNIDNVSNIKTLFHAGWLLADQKADEIILETQNSDSQPVFLKVIFQILCEGILNAGINQLPEEKYEIDYDQILIPNLAILVNKLTEITGIRFSYVLV